MQRVPGQSSHIPRRARGFLGLGCGHLACREPWVRPGAYGYHVRYIPRSWNRHQMQPWNRDSGRLPMGCLRGTRCVHVILRPPRPLASPKPGGLSKDAASLFALRFPSLLPNNERHDRKRNLANNTKRAQSVVLGSIVVQGLVMRSKSVFQDAVFEQSIKFARCSMTSLCASSAFTESRMMSHWFNTCSVLDC